MKFLKYYNTQLSVILLALNFSHFILPVFLANLGK